MACRSGRHRAHRLRRAPHVGLLFRSQPLEHLIPSQHPLLLLHRTRLQRPQPVQHPLLLIRRQPIEPRLPAAANLPVAEATNSDAGSAIPADAAAPAARRSPRPHRRRIPPKSRPGRRIPTRLSRSVSFSISVLRIRRLDRPAVSLAAGLTGAIRAACARCRPHPLGPANDEAGHRTSRHRTTADARPDAIPRPGAALPRALF